jgi:hypothetical protein
MGFDNEDTNQRFRMAESLSWTEHLLNDIESQKEIPIDGESKKTIDTVRLSIKNLLEQIEHWPEMAREEKFNALRAADEINAISIEIENRIQEEIKKSQYIAEAQRDRGKKLNERKLQNRKPEIELRKALLANSDYNLEELRDSRKIAEAVAEEFGKVCANAGIEPVSGKQIQRDARNILQKRHEKSGHS